MDYPVTRSINHGFLSPVPVHLLQDNDNVRGKDMSGKVYSDAEFDRVLPMFYYRQLAMENAIPDSIQGVPVDRQTIARNNFSSGTNPKIKIPRS